MICDNNRTAPAAKTAHLKEKLVKLEKVRCSGWLR